MERIEYGGVSMDVIQTQKFDRSAVLDEVGNYCMTKWEIEGICHFQPAMMSYELRNPLPIAPVFMPGKLPGETDKAILSHMLKPRQLLTVTAGGMIVLQTPSIKPSTGNRYPCDSLNGPTCSFVSAPRQIGEKHWMVHVRFVAHVSECTSSTNVVLSNVWTSTFDVDEFWYPTRIVAGKAILRTDMMREQHITADTFRADFFFPIDANYVRENVNVKLAEDGATLFWTFTDAGRCYNVAGTSPIRKVDIFKTTMSKAGSGMLAQRQAVEWGALETVTSQDVFGTTRAAPGVVFRFAKMNLPQHRLNTRCDIWGDRDSRHSDIVKISLGICMNQAIAAEVPFAVTVAEVICHQELSNRFVSSEISYRWSDEFIPPSPLVGIPEVIAPPVNMGINGRGGLIILNSLFKDYPSIYATRVPTPNPEVALPRDEILFQRDGVNPAPPNQSQSTLIENLVVQALLTPCQSVPVPNPIGAAS